ncbi:MAG TPA: SDR family NAD(P)-dependent oxidoreductase [Candidatus Saccharimonadales bacterium]|nr:SDR family NAD(P)-dependent oxidoreductase [Candidatus Saccharimonadales bacterium]
MTRKTFVIIGGTSGLGLEIAAQLDQCEQHPVVIGNVEEEVRDAERDVAYAGFVCDVSNHEKLEATLKHIFNTMGPIAGVVNCAAMWVHAGPFHELPPDTLRASTEVNFLGTAYAAHTAINQLLEQGAGGSLVLVAAMAAVRPGPGIALYAAQKAGVRQLALSLAQMYGPEGIRISVVHPGGMLTELQNRVGAQYTDPVHADAADVARVVVNVLLNDAPLVITDMQVVHQAGKW